MAWAIRIAKPMAIEFMKPLTSQMVEMFREIEAVASAPSLPTMAEST